jgi:hypothetical protein
VGLDWQAAKSTLRHANAVRRVFMLTPKLEDVYAHHGLFAVTRVLSVFFL